jgi:hypothetical protein
VNTTESAQDLLCGRVLCDSHCGFSAGFKLSVEVCIQDPFSPVCLAFATVFLELSHLASWLHKCKQFAAKVALMVGLDGFAGAATKHQTIWSNAAFHNMSAPLVSASHLLVRTLALEQQ